MAVVFSFHSAAAGSASAGRGSNARSLLRTSTTCIIKRISITVVSKKGAV